MLGIDASSLSLAATATADVSFTQAVSGGANASMTGVNWADYGFAAGQSFTLSGGGANNGRITSYNVCYTKLLR